MKYLTISNLTTPILLALSTATQLAHATVTAATPAVTTPSPTLGLLQVVLSLAVILALIMAAAWFAKRFMLGNMQTASTIKMLGGINLGGRERVILLEVADQWIVVGVAPGQVNTLATMPRQAIADSGAPKQPAFAAWLKQKMDKNHD
ncbi:MAG: flagellar biosynthetic protein FliO [Sulfuriferula sp.]